MRYFIIPLIVFFLIFIVLVTLNLYILKVRAGAMGGHVEGSPFLVKAYSASRVAVTDIAPGVVGRPVSFTINASHAGKKRVIIKPLTTCTLLILHFSNLIVDSIMYFTFIVLQELAIWKS